MARRRGLTDKQLAALARKPKRYIVSDPEQRGHYVRVPPHGPIVFTAVARDPYGRQVWAALGTKKPITQPSAFLWPASLAPRPLAGSQPGSCSPEARGLSRRGSNGDSAPLARFSLTGSVIFIVLRG